MGRLPVSRGYDEKAAREPAFSRLPTFAIERDLIARGYRRIGGVDEAGRGALAGPLCVGLVIFDASFIEDPGATLPGVNDSKLLTPRRRIAALEVIGRHSLAAEAILISHRRIDLLGITGATARAVEGLIARSPVTPDVIILDGMFRFDAAVPIYCVPKGDCLSLSVAAASILAKVRRDSILERLDEIYPGYRFARNKGYGTKEHRAAILRRGPSPVHRRSYEPVRSMSERRDFG